MLTLGALSAALRHEAIIHADGTHSTTAPIAMHALAYDPASAPSYEPPPPALTLKQVIVVMRHGDRTPIAHRAGRLQCDPAFWTTRLPESREVADWDVAHPVAGPATPIDRDAPFGMLTTRGASQARAYGAELRARYGRHAPHLLTNVSARATNIRRTQQTAQNVLLGLGAQGVAVEVREWEMENMVPKPTSCSRLRQLLAAPPGAPSAQDLVFLREVSDELDYPNGEFNMDQAREVLICVVAHSDALEAQSLPGRLSAKKVLHLAHVNGRAWSRMYTAPGVPRLAIGSLVSEIHSRLTRAVESGDISTLHLLSGHDSTLVPLLSALKIYDSHWPRYAAHLEIELATDDLGQHYARLLYDGKVYLPIEPSAEGSVFIEWERFRDLALQPSSITPQAFSRECAADEDGSARPSAGEDSLQATLTGKAG
ncbi:hypothetical protein AB1Y20_018390 [Prymnesium parvum]|uniref:Acid phosphatase n=1 Tax=Prymnesium parvum TaxID=97485 RepID=A0AB34JRS3_PRYPA